jgi:hypothetical protein
LRSRLQVLLHITVVLRDVGYWDAKAVAKVLYEKLRVELKFKDSGCMRWEVADINADHVS